MDATLLVTDHETLIGTFVEAAQFLADNEGDADLCEQVRRLAPGAGITVGGGAAPAFTISRTT